MAIRAGNRNDDKEKSWLNAFERFANSGLSQSKFCEQEHLSAKLFYYWFRRYREGKLSSKPPRQGEVKRKRRTNAPPNMLVPVRVMEQPRMVDPTPTRTRAPIEIFSPAGFVIRVPLEADEEVLASVLAALSRSAC